MSDARPYDVIVIGTGPAGMAAAATASERGLSVVILDEQARPGGQIYRNVGVADATRDPLLGKDYAAGRLLVSRLERSAAETRNSALVWDVTRGGTVTIICNGRSETLHAKHIVIATGAMERPSPVPGWTLPGVMNAGAAQIALKSGPSIPEGRVVLAGAGPLLLLVACQLLKAGANVVGVVETAPRANVVKALNVLPKALRAPAPLFKGLRMLATLKQFNVPWYRAVENLAIEGKDYAEGIRFRHRGEQVVIPADTVLLHHGVVPNVQISRLLRLEHIWNASQLAWDPVRDAWGESTEKGVWLVGDGSGIAGARAAEASGALSALAIAEKQGLMTIGERDEAARVWHKMRSREQAVRPFLDALYCPPHWISSPADNTIVCRCEEVTAGRVREMARLGCAGPNQTKFFSRCGMGPCQGRLCGLIVTQLLAETRQETPQAIGAYRVRAPIKPIPLASLAQMATDHDV